MKTSIILALSILLATGVAAQDRYKIKKAHIEYITETMGMSIKSTLDFDDYGKKQAVVTVIDMMGFKKTNKMLTINNYMYILDMEAKSGVKSPTDNQEDISAIDFANIPQEMKDEYKIVDLGTETVADKKCQVFSMENEGAKSKLWVWKNIPLKSEVEKDQMTVSMAAKKIEINPDFDTDTFEVPKDFTITDMD
ncbi:MAG: hypothetical protein DRJ10_10250 [Bacteroidetes bacterium]|nr:MAG: hypothetical protein DRJ10_10250 [Bacteroidota bacterium]